MADSRSRFQALDGWRGVCALLVAFFHLPVRLERTANPFFAHAWLFVDFFFVLSGFVIAHAYGRRLAKFPDFAVFIIKRIGRLWPLHVTLLGVLVAMEFGRLALSSWYGTANRAAFTGNYSVLLLLQNLTLLQVLRPEPLMSWNGPSWSITVEFWTYVIFALVMISTAKHRLVVKAAIIVASVTILLSCTTAGMDVTAWLAFFRCFFGFFTGQILYRVSLSATSVRWQSGWSGALSTFLEACCVLCVVGFVTAAPGAGCTILAPIVFAAVIYVFAPERGGISRVMTTKLFGVLGQYSYSIYMVHTLVIAAVLASLRIMEKLDHARLIISEANPDGSSLYLIEFGNEFTMLLLTVAVLTTIVLIAHFTCNLIERPGQTYFSRLAAKARSKLEAPLPASSDLYTYPHEPNP